MSETIERDYRNTLNLPETPFPMKAELPKREPERVRWWRERRTYERRLERNTQGMPWVLHDGPPYANGELHMGHFLNMALKDMFVKIALLRGRRARFVPGWDMHGLPIELETLKHIGVKDFHAIDPLELRARCRERALYWLERQRETRERMGCFADFEHPYRTIDPSFEATIVETLAHLAETGQLYRGLRATLWCIRDETALAEAEIEYETRRSPSLTVRFTADDDQRRDLLARFGLDAAELPARLSVLIWTTTPWTLPANAAIALRADAAYACHLLDGELLVVAEALAPAVFGERFSEVRALAAVPGARLEGAAVRHPLFDRVSPLVLAPYVDLETGTGAVHTAPGHGAEDFETGRTYGLPVLCPVDAAGRFTADAGPYAGLRVWEANARIADDLRARGALFAETTYEHSYPHCWRCHEPVIFRATEQWFISLDRNDLRARAIAAAREVGYTPSWGMARMVQMLEHHPEWCVSRQRTWGTPIPAVACTACGRVMLDPAVARTAARRFAEAGADVWWSDPVERYLPDGFACPDCGGGRFEKRYDIVDIWFESGVTHLAVLGRDDLPWPADLVLEGGDQYRGWFRSTLLTGVAVNDRAPYRHVVKNGWVNDEQGRPMSKSRGTGVDARDAMQRWGADVLRLWAASVEFVDDVRFGPNVVEQVARVYRNIRNRIRFMLGNIGDLPASELVPRERMRPFDALACAVADDLAAETTRLYDAFELHDAYLRIIEFESGMSSLYFDAMKDPLYVRAAADARRRSAQSALLHILGVFLTILAPVLSFTAEEAWQALPQELRGGSESIFDRSLDDPERLPAAERRASDRALWSLLRDLRARVAAGEPVRDLEADLTLGATPALYERLSAFGDDLREALVVSHVTLVRDEGDGEAITRFELVPAAGEKCRRCWKYRSLGADPDHAALCAECAAVVRAS